MNGEREKKHTILFVQDLMDPQLGGGIERSLQHLTTVLTAAGNRCITLSIDGGSGLRRENIDGVTHWKARATAGLWHWREDWQRKRPSLFARQAKYALSTYNPFIQKALRRIILTERPDIVSMHNINQWSVASWGVAAKAGLPVVQVLHGHSTICFHGTMLSQGKNCPLPCLACRFRRMTTPMLEHHLTAVVGVSHYILNRHLSLGRFACTPIKRVIHNGRHPRMLVTSGASGPIRRAGIRFGYIGRISEIKGIDRLIDAFRIADIPNSELWIAGTGATALTQRLKERSGSSRITWLGYTEPADFYGEVDVVVVPSVCNETFSGVVYEAQHTGKVVLGSNRGGTPEMIAHGESGLLFDPDSLQELAYAMRKVAGSEELRKRLSSGGMEASKKLMDPNRLLEEYENLYRDVRRHHDFTRRGMQ